jgi:glycerol-3-phosphate dehydrogenase
MRANLFHRTVALLVFGTLLWSSLSAPSVKPQVVYGASAMQQTSGSEALAVPSDWVHPLALTHKPFARYRQIENPNWQYPEFSMRQQEDTIQQALDEPAELMIEGGGIAGAATALHAAALGLKVTLIERHDIASGPSSSSTGLFHVGFRYLMNLLLRYVLIHTHERWPLEQLAPHLVHPQSFVFPLFSDDPFRVRMFLRLLMRIYHAIAYLDARWNHTPLPKPARTLSAQDIREKIPGIQEENLIGGVEYFVDGGVSDSRLTLAFMQAAAEKGARILTRMNVDSVTPPQASDGYTSVHCTDSLTGRQFTFQGKLLLLATGAAIDETRKALGFTEPVVQKSLGVHLITRSRLVEGYTIFSEEKFGKVFFATPYGKNRTSIGPTDTPHLGPADAAVSREEDEKNLIRLVLKRFPAEIPEGLNSEAAVERYRETGVFRVIWGLRPLAAEMKNRGYRFRQFFNRLIGRPPSTMKASRMHRLVQDARWLWSIVGTKLTAGRAVGEEVALAAYAHLRSEEPQPSAIPLAPLPGGDLGDSSTFREFVDQRVRNDGSLWGEEMIRYLAGTYGSRMEELLRLATLNSDLWQPVMPGEPWIFAEALYAAHYEKAATLNDFLWRRTKWALEEDIPESSVRLVAEVMALELEWNEARIAREIQDYHAELQRHTTRRSA